MFEQSRRKTVPAARLRSRGWPQAGSVPAWPLARLVGRVACCAAAFQNGIGRASLCKHKPATLAMEAPGQRGRRGRRGGGQGGGRNSRRGGRGGGGGGGGGGGFGRGGGGAFSRPRGGGRAGKRPRSHDGKAPLFQTGFLVNPWASLEAAAGLELTPDVARRPTAAPEATPAPAPSASVVAPSAAAAHGPEGRGVPAAEEGQPGAADAADREANSAAPAASTSSA